MLFFTYVHAFVICKIFYGFTSYLDESLFGHFYEYFSQKSNYRLLVSK